MSIIKSIEKKIEKNIPLSFKEGIFLFNNLSFQDLGFLANRVREKYNFNNTYYIINQHINYTNICKNKCKFCAFYRNKKDRGAYTYSIDKIIETIKNYKGKQVSEYHLVGGLNKDLPFSYYIDMLKEIKKINKQAIIQAFTAVEIDFISQIANRTIEETLKLLKKAGLDSLPGGGAEISNYKLKKKYWQKKITLKKWLDIMKIAHKLGIKSNATMLYGHQETVEDIIRHLIRIRKLQEQTNGFLSFIPLRFHHQNTKLKKYKKFNPIYDLKVYSISRIMLNNFKHIKAFWIMVGLDIAQVSQWYGVDDIDGTVVEEKITHSAGAMTPQALSEIQLKNLIKSADRIPIERNTLYKRIYRKNNKIIRIV